MTVKSTGGNTVILEDMAECVFTGLQMCLLYIRFVEKARPRLSSPRNSMWPVRLNAGQSTGQEVQSVGLGPAHSAPIV